MSNCGTYQGYKDHIKNGSQTCIDCRAANALYMRQYRHSRGINTRRLVPDEILTRYNIRNLT
jgi:hypothetical protein